MWGVKQSKEHKEVIEKGLQKKVVNCGESPTITEDEKLPNEERPLGLAKENIENLPAANRQEMKVELRRLMKKVPEELKWENKAGCMLMES